jgi:hypothetical protein
MQKHAKNDMNAKTCKKLLLLTFPSFLSLAAFACAAFFRSSSGILGATRMPCGDGITSDLTTFFLLPLSPPDFLPPSCGSTSHFCHMSHVVRVTFLSEL